MCLRLVMNRPASPRLDSLSLVAHDLARSIDSLPPHLSTNDRCLKCERFTANQFVVPSLQLGVLGFGLLIDGDFGIGVFPESEKILIGGLRLCGVAIDGIGAA